MTSQRFVEVEMELQTMLLVSAVVLNVASIAWFWRWRRVVLAHGNARGSRVDLLIVGTWAVALGVLDVAGLRLATARSLNEPYTPRLATRLMQVLLADGVVLAHDGGIDVERLSARWDGHLEDGWGNPFRIVAKVGADGSGDVQVTSTNGEATMTDSPMTTTRYLPK